jgi:hypothetical protein
VRREAPAPGARARRRREVVAARNAHDVDDDGCYEETADIRDYPDEVWMLAGEHMTAVLNYLECVTRAEAAEDLATHGQACDGICANACLAPQMGDKKKDRKKEK